jgi:hypothetical protein
VPRDSIDNHTGSIDLHADNEEKPSLVLKRAFLLNEEITTCAAKAFPSPSNQRVGSEDVIDLAVADWLELHEGDDHDHDGGKGFFAGKRFFHIAESENTVDGRFQLAVCS